MQTARQDVVLPMWRQIIDSIKALAHQYRDLPLLSRTHGQPATPSTIGKELANVAYRMERQFRQLSQVEILGKINGAVGNYNAHIVAYPDSWHQFSESFVTSLGIAGTHTPRKLNLMTTLPNCLIVLPGLILF